MNLTGPESFAIGKQLCGNVTAIVQPRICPQAKTMLD